MKMEKEQQLKNISADIHKIIGYFTEIKNDFNKFDYEEAQCMSEYLNVTINYLNAYILGNSNRSD